VRRLIEFIRIKIAEWTIRRYMKGMRVSDPITLANQQIAELQKQIAELRAGQLPNPMLTLEARLLAMHPPAADPVPAVEVPAAVVAEVIPEPESAQALQQAVEPVAPAPESAQALQQAVADPVPEPQPLPLTPLEPEPVMSTPAPVPATPPTPVEPPAAGSPLPDVKMIAPLLKIAMGTLSFEQMAEIILHVKMGAPGFKQFLESDIAKTKFRELYATYCDFLAGKVK
jgi:hypothetical protein